MSKNVTFLINKSEIAAGTRGASLGPEAIITAARSKGSFVFSEHTVLELPNLNYLLEINTPFKYAKRIDGLLKMYDNLNQKVSETLLSKEFPMILAADHGSAGGTIAGIRSAFPSKRLGVVWIDAHADIHTPYTTPSGNIHGMPLAAALAIDNLECKTNDVDPQTVSLWNQLKNVGNIAPKVNAGDIVYVAVRSTEPQENCIMEQLQIKNIPVAEVRAKGADQIVESINEILQECDIIYVSFDVDSMDPDLTSYGTGTPVGDGLKPEEALQLLTALVQNPKTVCVEIVEVNPCLDEKKNKMAEVAFSMIEGIMKIIKQ